MLGKWIVRGILLWGWVLCGLTAWADNVTLCYHRFTNSLEEIYSVLPDVYEWQVNYIKSQNIPFARVSELVQAYGSTAPAVSDSVTVTVDDGWGDVANVLPISQAHHVPMTLYLYPMVLDHGPYLKYTQLETLKNNPLIEFGCHSYTHPVLRRVSSKVLNHEVLESKAVLEKRLGRPLDTFAYPFGMYDHATLNLVKAHYRLGLGVNDDGNSAKTHQYNLNRFVIYRTTGFGEFKEMIARVKSPPGESSAYSTVTLGVGRETRHFVYTKAQVVVSPAHPQPRAVLVIPSMQIGAAWSSKIMDRLAQSGVRAYVMVSRNNNLPFYRPDKEIMRDVSEWSLRDYTEDLKLTLAYVRAQEKQFAVVTWGDGFDWLTATVAGDSRCAEGMAGVLAVNPSLQNPGGSPLFFGRERDRMDRQLQQGLYELDSLKFFIKVKTLADLMIVKPDAPSPFARRLGYGALSNRQVFREELDRLDHPELSVDEHSGEYTLAEFTEVFMRPLPTFSLVVPLRIMRDFHALWATGFSAADGVTAHPQTVSLPMILWASDAYRENPERIFQTFPNVDVCNVHRLGQDSTVEALLSDTVVSQVQEEYDRLIPYPYGPNRP